MRAETKQTKKGGMNQRRRKRILFYISIMILPIVQFCIFYFGVNFNSILRAFRTYEIDYGRNVMTKTFSGFKNFGYAWDLLKNNLYVLKHTFLIYGVSLIVIQPLCMIFSYYIFKKKPLSGLFKVMLFLPHVVSGLVFALLFRYITENVYTVLFPGQEALLTNPDTRLWTVIFFNMWLGFGGDLLLFSGAMGNVDDSILESAQLDGANMIQEFLYIVFPGIFSTYKQLVVLGLAGIFGNQMSLISLYGIHADATRELSTIGMLLYVKTYYSGDILDANNVSYGVLSAFGLMLTAVLVPTTLGVRKLLDKYGPSTV